MSPLTARPRSPATRSRKTLRATGPFIQKNSACATRCRTTCASTWTRPWPRAISASTCSPSSARWESPQYGTIAPGIFIPVLEEAHLIHKLDAYILHAVAKMAREKLDANLPVLPISVNLSRLDFLLQDPFAVAETIREEYRLPLGLIQIEVTENALVGRMDSVLNGIQKFQKKGYPVLLDDFGSGYSSLNVLKDYDFDTIKFDMKFLHPFTAKSRKILKYLVSMAKDLSVHTLAEGAETKEQCDFLREIGCEKIQGYYYGK
ncbi:EAL domain-containing protein, partial [Mitsuokella jalaludinii]|uniref:EAL domain-containing protein n=1 Tax=Mitsuokella jalaludinii TaxID=187979 RepID=UPI00307F60B7